MFNQAPKTSGAHQNKFMGSGWPPQVCNNSINQQSLVNLNWIKLLDFCQSAPSTFGAFISEHSQLLSYSNPVEYLNLALFIMTTNKDNNPTYAETMQHPDAAGFLSDMEVEIQILVHMNVLKFCNKNIMWMFYLMFGLLKWKDILTIVWISYRLDIVLMVSNKLEVSIILKYSVQL